MIDVEQILANRHAARLHELAAGYADQAARAALAGNPRRADYFDHWSRVAMASSALAAEMPTRRSVQRGMMRRIAPSRLYVPPWRRAA